MSDDQIDAPDTPAVDRPAITSQPVAIVRLRIDSGTAWAETGPVAVPLDQMRTATLETLLANLPMVEVLNDLLAKWREADADAEQRPTVREFRPLRA